MHPHFMLDVAMKAQQWERAKGELRAMVALAGSYAARTGLDQKWIDLGNRVEAFIGEIEDNALQE
jgi:hypothetical protein